MAVAFFDEAVAFVAVTIALDVVLPAAVPNVTAAVASVILIYTELYCRSCSLLC